MTGQPGRSGGHRRPNEDDFARAHRAVELAAAGQTADPGNAPRAHRVSPYMINRAAVLLREFPGLAGLARNRLISMHEAWRIRRTFRNDRTPTANNPRSTP